MPGRVYHRLNREQIRRLLESKDGPVARDVFRRGLRVESQAKINLGGVDGPKRVDTGRLRSDVSTELVILGRWPAARVGTKVSYALLVHNGTGVYGPTGQPIRPKRAKRLVFVPKGKTRKVFARQVRGMEPNRFLVNALPAARG